MIYLLWALINIGVFLFFIQTCFRATKLIREKFGLFTSLIFVLGLLSVGSDSGDRVADVKTFTLTSTDSVKEISSGHAFVNLEKNWISTYELNVHFRADRQGKDSIPISAYSLLDGFVSGTIWTPTIVEVNKIKETDKFEYLVIGITKWKLLGLTVYSQLKEFKGII